jgi:DNA repair exonuclease SbcCD ATPase subunit
VIEYKQLRWSNCFSYGENNTLDLTSSQILQLVGKNGHGKSSIALILEEVLFNKNSKGVKKQHIINRNSKAKNYSIGLDFAKDGVEYTIEVTRGSTQTVVLTKAGEDISSHTATQTFKDIEALVGYDHKTFSQIVYQSSTASLEFLTATDTARKKFLIDLLNLGKYTNALEVIKARAQAVAKEITVQETKLKQAQGWLAKYTGRDLDKKSLVEVPILPDSLYTESAQLEKSIQNVGSETAKIEKNLTYKKLLEGVELYPLPEEIFSAAELKTLETAEINVAAELAQIDKQLKQLANTKDKCPTCGQSLGVDTSHIANEVDKLNHERKLLAATKPGLADKISKLKAAKIAIDRSNAARENYEKYHQLYNPTLPLVVPNTRALEAELEANNATIKRLQLAIKTAQDANKAAEIHNAQVDHILEQISEFEAERDSATAALAGLVKTSSNYAVLVKAFSTTGLVAYKIECLVKDLEKITNEYLAEMADGRFQLSFEISQTDKLNVVITDNGTDIDIAALSTGERARVNVATLLAIRRLMQNLSNTRTNLLILDETIENLDADGKERLIEILLNEPELNTVLISHSFTHPLIDRISIVKERNMSRIDRG